MSFHHHRHHQPESHTINDFTLVDFTVYESEFSDYCNPNFSLRTIIINDCLCEFSEFSDYFSPKRIKFFVRMISSAKTLVLDAHPDVKLKLIHEQLQSVTGIPMMEQRLIYCGRQLQWEQSLAECMIKKDSNLHLVGSTKHPQVYRVIDELICKIYRLCKGEKNVCLKSVNSKLIEFLEMTANDEIREDHLVAHLNIFQSLCAPKALVMLYISPYLGNKECADECIRAFINYNRTMLAKPLYTLCASVVLEFCKLLGRGVSRDDDLYSLCRNRLGSIVEDLSLGRSLTSYEDFGGTSCKSCVVEVEDVFPFVSEIASKLNDDFSLVNCTPSSSDVRDFGKFLQPVKAAIKQVPDFGEVIPLPITYTLPCYDDEIKMLFIILFEMLEKVRLCLEKMEGHLATEQNKDLGYDQYLVILKELFGIAKLYQGAEVLFWSDLKSVKVSFCHLIVKYAKRGEDYKWIRGHKDLLDFEARRHLAMMENCMAPSQRKYKTAPIDVSKEAIEHQYGNTMKKAAENLKVSVSTLKRKCKFHRLPEWQGQTRAKKKVNDSSLQSDTDEEDIAAIEVPVGNGNIVPLARKYKTAPILVSQEAIVHQYGNTMKTAAVNLKISVSTLKRKCKEFGILQWSGPSAAKRKANDTTRLIDEEDIGAIRESLVVNRNKDTLTIKAEYKGDMISFYSHISQTTVATVREEIGKRFESTLGTYKLKYLDEDEEWILIATDEDMSQCIESSRKSGRTVVRLNVSKAQEIQDEL